MHRSGAIRLAWGIAAGASILFLLDLFLEWQRTTVEVAGTISAEASGTGWSGWGFVAGVLAFVLAAVAIASVRDPRSVRGHAVAVGVVPLGLFVATIAAVFAGNANVSVAGVVGVEVETDLWPTWAGLVLGLVASTAALAGLVLDVSSREERAGRPAVHLP